MTEGLDDIRAQFTPARLPKKDARRETASDEVGASRRRLPAVALQAALQWPLLFCYFAAVQLN
jgi:hypothetical protein